MVQDELPIFIAFSLRAGWIQHYAVELKKQYKIENLSGPKNQRAKFGAATVSGK